MNDDLISRSALKKVIEDSVSQYGGQYSADMLNMWALFSHIVNDAPTVEFPEQITIKCDAEEDKQKLLSALRNARVTRFVEEERPHGEWIKHIDNLYPEDSTEECPFCHEEQRLVGNDDNFCPNCGADMRKEVNNE